MNVIDSSAGALADVILDNVCPHLNTPAIANFSASCRFFYDTLRLRVDEIALRNLYQAIIDDNRAEAKKILDAKPYLLLVKEFSENHIIESKLTWQKFKLVASDTPLAVAAKRKQIEMINLLLPYYDQLAQDETLSEASRQYARDTREAGLNAWTFYTITKNARGKDEIEIPAEYSLVINNLIDVFSRENLAPGQTDFTQLSEDTESAMRSLLNLLVPKTAVELDNHMDVELLLLTAYQQYNQRFDSLASWEQRDAFCIRVIGLIQSALSPETAKVCCEGFCNVIKNKRPVGERAASHKLSFNEPFYRSDRESLSNLGGKYFCGEGYTGDAMRSFTPFDRRATLFYKMYMSNKNINLAELMRHSQPQPTQQAILKSYALA